MQLDNVEQIIVWECYAVTYSRVNNSGGGGRRDGYLFLVPIFKVGLRNVSFLDRQILWGFMDSVVLSLLSYTRKLFWVSLALKITLVLLEKFRNDQELDLWQHDSWAQTHWAYFPLKPSSPCKPTHFTCWPMSQLTYQQWRYIPWTVDHVPINKNTVQVRKYYSIKVSLSGDLRLPE